MAHPQVNYVARQRLRKKLKGGETLYETARNIICESMLSQYQKHKHPGKAQFASSSDRSKRSALARSITLESAFVIDHPIKTTLYPHLSINNDNNVDRLGSEAREGY